MKELEDLKKFYEALNPVHEEFQKKEYSVTPYLLRKLENLCIELGEDIQYLENK